MSAARTERDRSAIGELVSHYADAVNVADAERWGSTWAGDAVWELGPDRLIEGRRAIVAHWRAAMASFEHVVQVVCHGSVDPQAATGRWTLFEVNRREGADSLLVGCYIDRYVEEEGRWVFAERRFTAAYRGPLPEGHFVPFPPIEVHP